jgi:Alpha-L-arabinofuranosidase B (ABFB) domain
MNVERHHRRSGPAEPKSIASRMKLTMHRLLPVFVAAILAAFDLVLFCTAAFPQDAVFIESANALNQYMSLQSPPVLAPISSGNEKADGRIIWHPALDGEKGILFASFESGEKLGLYLRRKGEGLAVEKDDGTPQFARDASFKISFGNGGSLTLESVAQPGWFIRHLGLAMTLEPSDRTAVFKADASYFRIPFDER